MSAFIVSNDHINAIVTYCVDKRVSYWTGEERTPIQSWNAEEIGRILMDENVRSVVWRYRDSSSDFADEAKDAAAEYRYLNFTTPLTAVEVIKACHCLSYQSCETDEWEKTMAWTILQAVISHASREVPGYDAAPWGIDERSRASLKHHGQVSLLSLSRRGR